MKGVGWLGISGLGLLGLAEVCFEIEIFHMDILLLIIIVFFFKDGRQ